MLDENIKQNIKKCTRCALCTQNCPIYEIKKDENNCARGIVCKLSGYENAQLTKEELKHNLKICLNCSKCKNNCPSGIDTSKIFAYKNAVFYPSKINQRIFLTLKLIPVKFLYFTNLFFGKKTPKNSSDTVYFKGCIARSQHKKTFLDKILPAPDFDCCGLPYLSGGDIENYEKAKKRNIELIKNSKQVIFDCVSCKSTVEEYEELNEQDRKKLIFILDFLKDKKFKMKKNSKYKTVTFHKPCHMSNEEFKKTEKFLSSVEGIKYISLENPDKCCGFGGSYFLFHPVISTLIALKKAKEIKNTKADLILSACPSCIIGLRYNQLISFNFKKTLELRDFIEKELIEL